MMNYVGSITVLDRGDAPAQAVIDKNARSLAQRVADETRTELSKVMQRVDNIYGHYEMRDQFSDGPSNMEYVGDLKELEELITDQVKKKKYQKQVTIFIVGFESISHQKLRLLQQVNEFFMTNANTIDEDEDIASMSPDLDMEEVQEKIEDSLKTAEELTHRLADINQEMVDYLVTYANQKASNKGKKKLEKSLAQAKQDIEGLSEKLLQAGQEIEEKDEKVQQLFKQIEMKNMECQRYKTAAEIAKKSAEEAENLKLEIGNRDNKIRDLQKAMSQLEREVGMEENLREKTQQRMTSNISEHTSRLQELQDQVDKHQMEMLEARREQQQKHEHEINNIREEHRKDIEELKRQHADEIRKLLIERYSSDADADNLVPGGQDDGSRQSSRQETSRPTTKTSTKNKTPPVKSNGSTPAKSFSKQSTKSEGSKQKSKELSDASVQDEGGNADTAQVETKPSTRGKGKSSLETVVEGDTVTFASAFDIKDESSWASVPATQIPGRFIQYRALTKERLAELEDELKTTVTKTNRKVQTLKAQFQEHKNKWEAERRLLIDQIEQTQKMQSEAEKEADAAMLQLEDFIIEQEELEKEEEVKLKEVDRQSASQRSSHNSPVPAEEDVPDNLMQQTDDAKAQASRQTTFAEPSEQGEYPPIIGNTPEEIRISSAQSRASIRSHHKTVLEVQRAATEDRRIKSPRINVHAQKSMLSDAELNEDGDMPFPDDVKTGEKAAMMNMHDIGTSPPEKELSNLSRKSIPMIEHPIVQEYMKSYEAVIRFKDSLSKLLLDKEMMSLSQVLADIEPYHFDKDDYVQPQVEMMTTNVYHILEEVGFLLSSILHNDRDYPVSSLFNVSRDPTHPTIFSAESGLRVKSRQTAHSAQSRDSETMQNLMELQDQYNTLQRKLKEETRKHEEALNHNTVVMMEMQDTINSLQRELSNLGQKSRYSEYLQDESPESTIMFTRMDSERNMKIMKRAVNEGRIASQNFEDVVRTMDDYVSLPAKRFSQLVSKYVHHCQMKEIEENVRKSQSLNENVFQILDRMEMLQNMRAKKWAEKMDDIGAERLRLANLLMHALDRIERDSGIFLIKPMFSYRGKNGRLKYTGKVSRNYKAPPGESSVRSGSAVAPAPTPSTTTRPVQDAVTSSIHQDVDRRAPSAGQSGVTGNMAQLVGEYPRPVWNATSSLPHLVSDENLLQSNSHINTPRILELDINRMLIGQNQVSMMVPPQPSTDDRLINAANSSTRSYVTVSRPAAHFTGSQHKERPNSHTGIGTQSSAPPTTPQHRQTPHSASSRNSRERITPPREDSPLSRTIPATPPLPPIAPSGGMERNNSPTSPKDIHEPPVPPRSPPGSSLRQTPYSRGDQLPESPPPGHVTKVITRPSSQQSHRSTPE